MKTTSPLKSCCWYGVTLADVISVGGNCYHQEETNLATLSYSIPAISCIWVVWLFQRKNFKDEILNVFVCDSSTIHAPPFFLKFCSIVCNGIRTYYCSFSVFILYSFKSSWASVSSLWLDYRLLEWPPPQTTPYSSLSSPQNPARPL